MSTSIIASIQWNEFDGIESPLLNLDDETPVLLAFKSDGVFECTFINDDDGPHFRDTLGCLIDNDDITHWALMPDHPGTFQ